MASVGKRLSALAAEFRAHLDPNAASLAEVDTLEMLLTSMGAVLTDLVRGQPVLVVGFADDALAQFLQSIGCSVVSSDAAGTDNSFGLAIIAPAAAPVTDPQPLLNSFSQVADYCLFPLCPDVGLLNQAGWELCASEDNFCILRRSDLFTNGRLLEGWYPAEGPRDGWRWSADLAKIRFQTPRNGWVRFIFFVPPERMPSIGTLTAGALMAGEVLACTEIGNPGIHHLEIPIVHPQGPTSDLTFWISPGSLSPGDERLLGVIVRQIHFVASAP
jgi:hypothetical protein